MNAPYVVMLTMEEAMSVGIVTCHCGHKKSEHFRPTNFEYCMHCTCEGCVLNSFSVGKEIHPNHHKDKGQWLDTSFTSDVIAPAELAHTSQSSQNQSLIKAAQMRLIQFFKALVGAK